LRELRLFRAYCPHGSVLDVGCSSGAFLYQVEPAHPVIYKIWARCLHRPLNHAEKMGVPWTRQFPGRLV